MATRTLTDNPDALVVLYKTNAQLALQKFERNILNADLRIIVDLADKYSLADAIDCARWKEVTLHVCNYCKSPGQEISECRNYAQPQAGTSRRFGNNNYPNRHNSGNNFYSRNGNGGNATNRFGNNDRFINNFEFKNNNIDKNGATCEETKITTYAKMPRQISSTASRPFEKSIYGSHGSS